MSVGVGLCCSSSSEALTVYIHTYIFDLYIALGFVYFVRGWGERLTFVICSEICQHDFRVTFCLHLARVFHFSALWVLFCSSSGFCLEHCVLEVAWCGWHTIVITSATSLANKKDSARCQHACNL